jgi:hypothetical protein
LHAAAARLSLKTTIGVGSDVDYPVARCHEGKCREDFVFVGGMVGFIVISMYLPMFSIYEKIR